MLNLLIDFLFCDIDWSIVIDIISIITSSVLSIVAIAISVKTLKQSNNAIIETSRADIKFFFDTPTGVNQYIVLKNFGNSSGTIVDFNISPKLDYSKSPKLNDLPGNPTIIDYRNIVLAPGQTIKSWFPLRDYKDKRFNVSISYKTLNKTYTENYPLDVSYVDSINYIYTTNSETPDEKTALVGIENNLMRLTEKL